MGIYVGGKGSVAIIKITNIVKNGIGNSLNNGIVREFFFISDLRGSRSLQ